MSRLDEASQQIDQGVKLLMKNIPVSNRNRGDQAMIAYKLEQAAEAIRRRMRRYDGKMSAPAENDNQSRN